MLLSGKAFSPKRNKRKKNTRLRISPQTLGWIIKSLLLFSLLAFTFFISWEKEQVKAQQPELDQFQFLPQPEFFHDTPVFSTPQSVIPTSGNPLPLQPKKPDVIYVSPDYEIEGDIHRHHLFVHGIKIATVETNSRTKQEKVYYHHSDHLGGSNLTTDQFGSITEETTYHPFGETRSHQFSKNYQNDYLYTGKEKDKGTDLYYYGARYYDPSIGRFTSVDPLVLDQAQSKKLNEILQDPQQLNAYAYARNNPLKYVDKEGESAEKIDERFEGMGKIIDGFSGGIASYYATIFSQALPPKLRKVGTAFGISLAANSTMDIVKGVRQVYKGEKTHEISAETTLTKQILNAPLSVVGGGVLVKTFAKEATNIDLFEDTLNMVGTHVEAQARSVMTVDVTRHKPIENTQLIQGPSTFYDRAKRSYESIKVKLKSLFKINNKK